MTDAEREEQGITRQDLDALTRAMETARRDPEEREFLDDLLRERTWFDVAKSAAYHCQSRALGLRVTPPCACSLDEEPYSEQSDAGTRLLRRMLDAGVSMFEPDIETAMQARRGRRRA